MTPGETRDVLLADHTGLRAHADAARQMVELWTRGEAKWLQVRDELARLADALRSHNLREERALRDLICSPDASGAARAHVMDEAHVSEHRDTFDALIRVSQGRDPGREGPHLEALLSRLLGHMAWEERSFLNATVLPNDTA